MRIQRIVIAGGTGFLGNCLSEHFSKNDTQVIILTRGKAYVKGNIQYVTWDAKTLGLWAEVLEGADALINLTGKSVDCRYTQENRKLIYSSRLESTAVLGKAIQLAKMPPSVWINAASATIYRHAMDKEMDEYTGEIGSGFSVDVCQQWENIFNSIDTPQTRKVCIRTSIVLGKKAGAFIALRNLVRVGLGGRQGPGYQFFSWLHEKDFSGIISFLAENETCSGVYNLAAPNPTTNAEVMRMLRRTMGVPIGVPLPKTLLEFGAVLIGTEAELVLKSRRVVPKRLLEEGYQFEFSNIDHAIKQLCQ